LPFAGAPVAGCLKRLARNRPCYRTQIRSFLTECTEGAHRSPGAVATRTSGREVSGGSPSALRASARRVG
jgi:hypothetical protein